MSRVSQNAASSGENKGGTATMAPPGTPQATPQPPLTELGSQWGAGGLCGSVDREDIIDRDNVELQL